MTKRHKILLAVGVATSCMSTMADALMDNSRPQTEPGEPPASSQMTSLHSNDVPVTPDTSSVSTTALEDTQNGIGDIVVTAERRASSVQRTPISISAVDSEALRRSGITSLEGLNDRIPNLSFQRNAGDAMIFIRGIGYNSISPGSEARVALYTDGIYNSRNQVGLLGFYDVDRIEVLRGPQGTLYGRNAIAGTINIITREPGAALNGYVTGTLGDYGLIGTEGAIGGPIMSKLDGRISFRTADRNGYGRNLNTGEDVNDERTRSVRGRLKYQPSEKLTIHFNGDYTRERDHQGGYRYGGRGNLAVQPLSELLGSVPTDPQDAAGFGPRQYLETYGGSAQIDFSLADSTTITFLSGYRHFVANQESNVDNSTAELSRQYISERSNVYTQELRLSQKIGGFADLIVGGYLFHEKNNALLQLPFKGILLIEPFHLAGIIDPNTLYEFYGSFGRVRTNAKAVFAQTNIHLTDQLQLDIGGRYSHERKRIFEEKQLDVIHPFVLDDPLRSTFNPALGQFGGEPLNQSASWSSFDPKATLSYQAARGLYLYATYSRGFKSGGFNVGGLQAPFEPEKLTNYEAGVKADLFDRRLRINISAFNYDYVNLQENIVNGINLVTTNAAKARLRGVEIETTARPTDDLAISVNGSYLDGKFRRFVDTDPAHPDRGVQNLRGNQLPNAPRYQIGGEIGYTVHSELGDFTPRVNVTWFDKIYFNQFNTVEASQDWRTMVNLYLSWNLAGSSWSASAYIKNLTDDDYLVNTQVGAVQLGYPKESYFGAPRTIGMSLTKTF